MDDKDDKYWILFNCSTIHVIHDVSMNMALFGGTYICTSGQDFKLFEFSIKITQQPELMSDDGAMM